MLVQAAPQPLKGGRFAHCPATGGPELTDLSRQDRQCGRHAQHGVSQRSIVEVAQAQVDDVDLGIRGERAAGQAAGGLQFPGLRRACALYRFRAAGARAGTSGSTRDQNSSDTTHDSSRLAASVRSDTAFRAARTDSLLFTDKL